MTWNLGGMHTEKVLAYFEAVANQREHPLGNVHVFLLQELTTREITVPGSEATLNTRENLKWRLTFHRAADLSGRSRTERTDFSRLSRTIDAAAALTGKLGVWDVRGWVLRGVVFLLGVGFWGAWEFWVCL